MNCRGGRSFHEPLATGERAIKPSRQCVRHHVAMLEAIGAESLVKKRPADFSESDSKSAAWLTVRTLGLNELLLLGFNEWHK